jgi:hypothetical protein
MYCDQSTVTPFFLEVTGLGDWWQVEPGDYGADEICVRRTEDETEYLIAHVDVFADSGMPLSYSSQDILSFLQIFRNAS